MYVFISKKSHAVHQMGEMMSKVDIDSSFKILFNYVFPQLNRKVYLGLYDNRTWPEPDSRDEQRVRDFMVQKYENKRFFVAPTEAMREEARRMNDAALSKQPQTKPLRALLGENATRLVVGNSQVGPVCVEE